MGIWKKSKKEEVRREKKEKATHESADKESGATEALITLVFVHFPIASGSSSASVASHCQVLASLASPHFSPHWPLESNKSHAHAPHIAESCLHLYAWQMLLHIYTFHVGTGLF